MIGCTKLLCGTATVSDAVKYQGISPQHIPAKMLQFSSSKSPLVVFNVTKKCNLKCKHCYIEARNKDFSGELTTEEAKTFIDDLASIKTPVLLFSGGEHLIRGDIYEIAEHAFKKGIMAILSTNGTLITKRIAQRIKDANFKYVGVSLDGLEEIHDKFRGVRGAFNLSLKGIKNSIDAGLKTGVRFTVTRENFRDLPKLVDLIVENDVLRFCMYHLVYSGRGKEIFDLDLSLSEKMELIQYIVNESIKLRDKEVEILTVDNHADGIYILEYVKKHQPKRFEEVKKLLKMHGGCSA
ncbi:MAG: radical SAM protein, partial [Candidatus Methanofastidiosia archaeon]